MCAHLLCTHQSHSCLQAVEGLHLQVFPAHPIQNESRSWSSSDSQAMRHTRHTFSALTISCFFSFCFRFLGVQLMYRKIVALLPCPTKSQSHGLFFTPFSHEGVICGLAMHPVMLSNSAAFFKKILTAMVVCVSQIKTRSFFSENFIAPDVSNIYFALGICN